MRPHSLVWALCIASAYMYRVHAYDPFFIIGHMTNSIRRSKEFLDKGANALEIDIQFDSFGNATSIYHGRPCDCFQPCKERSDIEVYMNQIRNWTSPYGGYYNAKLRFLMLDLKADKIENGHYVYAGYSIAGKILSSLWNNVAWRDALPVILSIPHTKYIGIFHGVRTALLRQLQQPWFHLLGYAIDSFKERGNTVGSAFRALGILSHRWVGTGITNCYIYWRESEQTDLLTCRHCAFDRCGAVDKAFHWTVDAKSSIREAITRGYDAVITNDPDDAVAVVRELGKRMGDIQDIWHGC